MRSFGFSLAKERTYRDLPISNHSFNMAMQPFLFLGMHGEQSEGVTQSMGRGLSMSGGVSVKHPFALLPYLMSGQKEYKNIAYCIPVNSLDVHQLSKTTAHS